MQLNTRKLSWVPSLSPALVPNMAPTPSPVFEAGEERKWKSIFSSRIFPFQLQREPKWRLEMAVAGRPEQFRPHSLVQSSSFFLLSPSQGEGRGASSHCVLSLNIVSHMTGACHCPLPHAYVKCPSQHLPAGSLGHTEHWANSNSDVYCSHFQIGNRPTIPLLLWSH